MGLFNFFKKSNEPKTNTQAEQIDLIPTIKPDKDLFICYDEVYFNEMKNIQGISEEDIKNIHVIIIKGEGGFLNMGNYHKPVYEKYFKNKNWTWVEYENWNDICINLGKYPSSFPVKNTVKDNEINIDFILNALKIAELKSILKHEKIEFQEKSKKNELINLIKNIININNNKTVIEKFEEKQEVERYNLYTLLMRTIHFRATNLFNEKRSKNIGVKKYELSFVYEEDREFVNIALSKNPNAIPPFFPSDLTLRTPIIDFE